MLLETTLGHNPKISHGPSEAHCAEIGNHKHPHAWSKRMRVQTAEYTTRGPDPSEVTTLGAQDCHHCPHKSTLLDSRADTLHLQHLAYG